MHAKILCSNSVHSFDFLFPYSCFSGIIIRERLIFNPRARTGSRQCSRAGPGEKSAYIAPLLGSGAAEENSNFDPLHPTLRGDKLG